MRRYSLALAGVLALWMVGDHAVLAQNPPDNCGPRYRRDPVATNRAREAKKAEMRRAGFPERFLHLLDREECVACVEMASDAFHIKVVYNDDENAPVTSRGSRWTAHTFQWDPQSERWAREQLAAGKIKAFYIMNTATRCQCCPDVNDDSKTNASYSDWNEDLDLHMSHVIPFEKPGDLGPLPADLENPPPGWTEDVPNIQQFFKPPKRVVHVVCQACQPIADRWNSAADTLDYLWDRKLSLQEGIAITENAMANRRNQIARLEYQQLFASTATEARQKQIDELKKVNEQQQEGVEREERQLAEVDKSIAEQNARMAAIMKELLACEEKCKTTTATATATTTGTTPGTTPGTPPVAASPAPPPVPQPGGQPQVAPAVCPDCAAAAAEAARINAEIQARTAELDRLREAQNTNTANLNNLVQLRAEAARRGNQAQVAEYERRISDLQAANRANREQQFKVREDIEALNEALAKVAREVDACNSRCAVATPGLPTNTVPGTTGGSARRTVAVPDLGPMLAACAKCEYLAQRLRQSASDLRGRAQRANDLQTEDAFQQFENLRVIVEQVRRELDECNKTCTTTATAPTTTTTAPRTGGLRKGAGGGDSSGDYCDGAGCGAEWKECTGTNSCEPIDTDCGVPFTCTADRNPCALSGTCPEDPAATCVMTGTCTAGASPGPPPLVDLTSPNVWDDTIRIEIEVRIQTKGTDVFDPADFPQWKDPASTNESSGILIPAVPQQQVRQWFNPLGLLTRGVAEQIERWRGSMGPRPLLRPRDLDALGAYSSGEQLGLPRGVHVLLTDRGGSTGKTLAMQILNLSGRPVRLAAKPFAVEPIRQQAQQQIQQAFNRLAKAAPIRLDLAAYCLEFLKAPPSPNQILRLAPPAVQQKFAPMSKVLRSAYRVQKAGLLNPDSNPAAYSDSIKQWAVWAVEQKLNESRFTEAFIAHTKKNVEAAGQQWPKQAEDMIRKVSPNRWRDIARILQGAGLPVPQ